MSDTLEGLESSSRGWSRRQGSRLALGLMLLVVVVGATSWLGVRTESVATSRSGYALHLDYPRVARAGLDVTWRLSVQHAGGFDKTLTLELSADQFDIYEHQAFYPSPDSETRDGNDLLLTFIAPPGDTFEMSFDAYVQPSSQVGRDGTVAVLDGGKKVATVAYSTWLAP